MLGDERVDVFGEEVVFGVEQLGEQAVFFATPVRPEFDCQPSGEVTCTIHVTRIECADRIAAEVHGPLVFGGVIPQERHVPATAVLAHSLTSLSTHPAVPRRSARSVRLRECEPSTHIPRYEE